MTSTLMEVFQEALQPIGYSIACLSFFVATVAVLNPVRFEQFFKVSNIWHRLQQATTLEESLANHEKMALRHTRVTGVFLFGLAFALAVAIPFA